MKKLLIFFSMLLLVAVANTSCRMAPSNNPGDTVAASEFNPIDTTVLNRKARAYAKSHPVKDSIDIFYVGDGSTSQKIQLVSYPSHRDTVVYGKTSHIKRSGNTDVGHVVRIKLWISNKGDSLVQRIEEVKQDNAAK